MDEMDLNGVSMFVRVVQLGSFSKAGNAMRVPKSTVSKRVAELESHLHTTLLRRTTRSLQLTEAGRAFFDQASKSLAELKGAETNAQSTGQEPMGLLRVTAVADFATQVLAPVFSGFIKLYPNVTLELVLTDRVLDLVNDNIDIAIRIGRLTDSSMKSRRLGIHRYQLVASLEYLGSHPAPKTPDDLKSHACLVFVPRPDFIVWRLHAGANRVSVKVNARFLSNSASAVKALVLDGAGIALLPLSICIGDLAAQRLKIVLPSWSLPDAPVHFVYQSYLLMPPKLTAFMDYVGERLRPFLKE